MNHVIHRLRRAVLLGEEAPWTDAQLLESFLSRRDPAAMEVLVRRHGPMVWGVCRRVLRDYHHAEDAFQATFLVLVRKAASITTRELLANWLYGVAHRTALKARQTAARRRKRESPAATMPEPAATGPERADGLRLLLDEELSGLPDKYRVAVVLCDLEGKTRKEAARRLGVPEGTVASRLTRARGMLARRLARRGLALCGAALTAALAQERASARVPAPVVATTKKAVTLVAAGQAAAGVVPARVAALTRGVLHTMLLSKLKIAGAVLLALLILGAGGGALVRHSRAAENGPQQSAEGAPGDARDGGLEKTLRELDERWWKADVEGLRRLAADDLVTVSGVGRYDKADLLEASKHRRPADWSKRDVVIPAVSKDVAVMTYVYDCKVLLADGTLLETRRDRRVSMVWAKRKGHWVVVFAQETTLPGGE
jgi:RNA polymerase sigma factor (sigma-70 family)